jgi:hypothetical protein
LGRRQVVVENHRVHVLAVAEIGEFVRLAFADERGGIERFHLLQAVADNFAAGGGGQFAELGH